MFFWSPWGLEELSAACVGGEKVAAVGGKGQKGDPEPPAVSKGAAKRAAAALGTAPSLLIEGLVEKLRRRARMPSRDVEGPFFFAIDHCFPIRGQGTVVTGTALRGACRVNDVVELPELGLEKKVKSMQMFRQPVQYASQGDRLGLCVKQARVISHASPTRRTCFASVFCDVRL